MAQMGHALVAMHFGPLHEPAAILGLTNHFITERRIERRPARAAFELCRLFEQRRIATDTAELSSLFRKVVMGMRPFRAMLARDLKGLVRQQRLPLALRFDDLFHLYPFQPLALVRAWRQI